MLFKGFFVTNNNKNGFDKIVKRIREVGVNAYNYHKCMPRYIIIFKEEVLDYTKGNQIIYFECDNLELNRLYLLGFGFEGLIEDEDKINVIEEFGKYRCVVNSMNNIEINDQYIEVFKFEF